MGGRGAGMAGRGGMHAYPRGARQVRFGRIVTKQERERYRSIIRAYRRSV